MPRKNPRKNRRSKIKIEETYSTPVNTILDTGVENKIFDQLDMRSLGRLGTMSRDMNRLTRPHLLSKLQESQTQTHSELVKDLYDKIEPGVLTHRPLIPGPRKIMHEHFPTVSPIMVAKIAGIQRNQGTDTTGGFKFRMKQGFLQQGKAAVIRKLMNLEGYDYKAGIQRNKDIYGYDINELPTIDTLARTNLHLPGPVKYTKLLPRPEGDTSSDSDTN